MTDGTGNRRGELAVPDERRLDAVGRVRSSVGGSVSTVDVLAPVVSVLVVVGGWTVLTAAIAIPAYLLPPPTAVFARLLEHPELFASHAVATLERILIGGAVGIGGGFLLALAVVAARPIRYALLPYMVLIRVLPKVAIAPALVIAVGTGRLTAATFVALIAFFPMALSTIAGLDRPAPRYEELMRSVDATRYSAWTVRMRFALPDVFAGLKQSVTLSVVGAVVAEWLIVDDGLGALVLLAAENLATDLMLAALVVLIAGGLALYGLVAGLERWLLWHEFPS